MGNGGYTSLHTDVHLVYDAPSNQFLPGNHVVLTDRATQCLTDFSLDFERTVACSATDGPDLTVQSVVGQRRARVVQVRAADLPRRPERARTTRTRWRTRPRRSTRSAARDNNPLPPACTPQVTGNDVNAQNGEPCPANKLVITPAAADRGNGTIFKVTVAYTGRPGVHLDGDGSTEGWFRNDNPAGDGGFVTTEPVGTEDWMPLNNHPTAKPTYDFYDTVNAGRTAIANGSLLSTRAQRAGRALPGRLDDLPLALAGADRELPGREQRRRTST